MISESKTAMTAPEELMKSEELLLLGKIVAVHGLKGAVRVKCNEPNLEKFTQISKIIPASNQILAPLTVKRAAIANGVLILFFSEIDSKEAALEFVSCYAFALKSEIIQPQNDEWWARDLIGLEAYTTENVFIGTICNIISTGNDLLEIRPADISRRENYLIPFVKEIVPLVDIKLKRVEIKVIPGLLEL
jgi:16S rRNA processing protein RimM